MISSLLCLSFAAACLQTAPKQGAVRQSSQALSSGDPKVDQILDRLDQKGKAIKGLSCQLRYKFVTVAPVQDEQVKEGELLFARTEPNAKFLVHFTKLKASGLIKETGEYFFFDGEWLTERNDKSKTVIRRQVARPGEKIDPFEIGKGPFPLPFGQQRAEILRNFKVTRKDFEIGNPRNTDHLHCIPLPNTELAKKYRRVELFIDRQSELPVRIVTERVSDDNRIEVDFLNVNTSAAPAGSRFSIETPRDFEVTTEPLSTENQLGDSRERR